MSYAFSHRLLSVADGGTTRSFGYAADGSVVSDDRGAEVFGFTYDAAGRLTAVEKNSAPEAAYAYDAFGLRVFKDLTIGGTTHANYDPDGRLLAESAATGVADREYIWLPLDYAGDDQALGAADRAGDRGRHGAPPHPLPPHRPTRHAGGDDLGRPRPAGMVGGATPVRRGREHHRHREPRAAPAGPSVRPETGSHQDWHRDYNFRPFHGSALLEGLDRCERVPLEALGQRRHGPAGRGGRPGLARGQSPTVARTTRRIG